MPLRCKSHAQGQIVPEILEAIVNARQHVTYFLHFPNQTCLTNLHQYYLITCGWEVHGQEMDQDSGVCLNGCRLEAHRNVHLSLI